MAITVYTFLTALKAALATAKTAMATGQAADATAIANLATLATEVNQWPSNTYLDKHQATRLLTGLASVLDAESTVLGAITTAYTAMQTLVDNIEADNMVVEELFQNVAAAIVVHAAIASNIAHPVTTAITNPDVPRNLEVIFAALWDGGDVTIVGTGADGEALTEIFLDPGAGGGTVIGVSAFATVTSIDYTTGAGGGLTITPQVATTGVLLGVTRKPVAAFLKLSSALAAGPAAEEAIVAEDLAEGAFTPTTAPSDAQSYTVYYTTQNV